MILLAPPCFLLKSFPVTRHTTLWSVDLATIYKSLIFDGANIVGRKSIRDACSPVRGLLGERFPETATLKTTKRSLVGQIFLKNAVKSLKWVLKCWKAVEACQNAERTQILGAIYGVPAKKVFFGLFASVMPPRSAKMRTKSALFHVKHRKTQKMRPDLLADG